MIPRTSTRLLQRYAASARPTLRSSTTPQSQTRALRRSSPFQSTVRQRSFHFSAAFAKGIQPDSSDPKPPNVNGAPVAGAAVHVTEPSPLTAQEYYDYSEHYFNVLLGELERVQEEGSDVEAEYSAGVLNISVPAIGTYVLNKQPPNKQIWLSSPISGPKRYDWIIEGDRMHEKQETREFAHGQWVYLRDGSNLTDLLNAELTLSLPKDVYGVIVDA